MVVCPPTPEWKRSSELDLNGEAVPDDDDGIPGPDLQVGIIYIVLYDILAFSIFSLNERLFDLVGFSVNHIFYDSPDRY